MNAVILGAGIGAILLSVLWTLALLLCFISLRTKYNLGPFAISITIFVTIILLSVPRKSDIIQSLVPGEKILDPLFVWRTSVLLFLGICSIASTVFLVMSNVMEVKQAKPIKTWYLKSS